jgi:translation initiation factor 2 beta subunit (eIF-2beta)/eIF-5
VEREKKKKEEKGKVFSLRSRVSSKDVHSEELEQDFFPEFERLSKKKMLFVNFIEGCWKFRNRHYEHIMRYLCAELSVRGSLDGAKRLVFGYEY